VTLPLRRQGQSLERRRGQVRLRIGRRVIVAGAFVLDSDVRSTSTRVTLNARGRAALEGDGAVRVQAQVVERGNVVSVSSLRLR
jgi:hypothetical protein